MFLRNLLLRFRKKSWICWWGCGSKFRLRSPHWWRSGDEPVVYMCPDCGARGVLNMLVYDDGKPWVKPEGTYLERQRAKRAKRAS